MKILVVGGGGREHAIIKKIKENKDVTAIYALPGNGGMAKDAICVNIGAKDIEKIVEFAVENNIDFAVVAPDDPLMLGMVDALEKEGIKMAQAEVTMLPQTYVELTDENAIKSLQKTLDLLDEDDDVQAVYHNWDE